MGQHRHMHSLHLTLLDQVGQQDPGIIIIIVPRRNPAPRSNLFEPLPTQLSEISTGHLDRLVEPYAPVRQLLFDHVQLAFGPIVGYASTEVVTEELAGHCSLLFVLLLLQQFALVAAPSPDHREQVGSSILKTLRHITTDALNQLRVQALSSSCRPRLGALRYSS